MIFLCLLARVCTLHFCSNTDQVGTFRGPKIINFLLVLIKITEKECIYVSDEIGFFFISQKYD